MSKVLLFVVSASVVSFCLANDQQIFQQTSKPFFPSSASSSSVSISSSTNGPIQFGEDVQKPAVIPGDPQPPFSPQTRPALQPDVTFSTIKPNSNPSQTGDNRQHTDPRFCTKIQDPVCGSNGRTYGNLCMLTQDQRSDPSIVLAKQGEC